jgi:hypothetical protein
MPPNPQKRLKRTAGTPRRFPQPEHYTSKDAYQVALLSWVFIAPECVCMGGECIGCESPTSVAEARFVYIPKPPGGSTQKTHPQSLYPFLKPYSEEIAALSERGFFQLLSGASTSVLIQAADCVLGDNLKRRQFYFENPLERASSAGGRALYCDPPVGTTRG